MKLFLPLVAAVLIELVSAVLVAPPIDTDSLDVVMSEGYMNEAILDILKMRQK